MYSVTTRVAEMFLNENFTPIIDFSSMVSMVCRENAAKPFRPTDVNFLALQHCIWQIIISEFRQTLRRLP
jgi:hypothetical protein